MRTRLVSFHVCCLVLTVFLIDTWGLTALAEQQSVTQPKADASLQSKSTVPPVANVVEASLRLKWLYDPGSAGEMVAAKAGFFVEHGLDVALKPGGFEADPIKLVASGSDTFGVAGADSFLLAREKGVPIVAFAAGYLETPVVYYVRAESGITSPKDFAGKRVGYQAGQDTATVYETLLRRAGIKRRQVREIPVKYDFTPFLTKRVDVWPGYAATQSYILQRENIKYNVIRPSQFGLSYLGTVYFTTERFIAKNPAIVQAFVDGLIKGWEYAYANYDAAIPMIASYDTKNLTPDLIRFNLDMQKAFILPPDTRFCEYSMKPWEALQAILIEQRLLRIPVDLGQAVTSRFLEVHYNREQQK